MSKDESNTTHLGIENDTQRREWAFWRRGQNKVQINSKKQTAKKQTAKKQTAGTIARTTAKSKGNDIDVDPENHL